MHINNFSQEQYYEIQNHYLMKLNENYSMESMKNSNLNTQFT